MTERRLERFAAACAALAEVFNEALSDVKIEAYSEALHDLPMEALEAGARRVIRDSRFFPRPSEWREHAVEWLRQRAEEERRERMQKRSLREDAESLLGTPEQQAARAKSMIRGLAEKLGWGRA